MRQKHVLNHVVLRLSGPAVSASLGASGATDVFHASDVSANSRPLERVARHRRRDPQVDMPSIRSLSTPDYGLLSDSELVELSRDDDPTAFGELWRRHRPAALAAARR